MEPKQQPPYPLRMTPELRSRLEAEAMVKRRSLNAEIADRLERSLSMSDGAPNAVDGFGVALAKAEVDAARAEVQAEARLFAAAFLATTLLEMMIELDSQGMKLSLDSEILNEAYAAAYKLKNEADHHSDSGIFDAVIKRAEANEKRLQLAKRKLSSSVSPSGAPDIPPERTVKFKGSSGIARKVAVSTKATRRTVGDEEKSQ